MPSHDNVIVTDLIALLAEQDSWAQGSFEIRKSTTLVWKQHRYRNRETKVQSYPHTRSHSVQIQEIQVTSLVRGTKQINGDVKPCRRIWWVWTSAQKAQPLCDCRWGVCLSGSLIMIAAKLFSLPEFMSPQFVDHPWHLWSTMTSHRLHRQIYSIQPSVYCHIRSPISAKILSRTIFMR